MLEKFLEEIGLSGNEAKVYLALLELDHESVLELSRRTSINRTTIYPILESLARQGLVSEVQIGAKTHYQAEPPERLETVLERRRVELDGHRKRLSEVVPEMKSRMREGAARPVVKYYDGKEGVVSSMEDFFSAGAEKSDSIYMVYNKDRLDGHFTEKDRERYRGKRVHANVPAVALYWSEKVTLPEKGVMSECKKLPADAEVLCDLAVAGDKVRVITLGKKVSSLIIQHPDIAHTLRVILKDYYRRL
jgi:sugar-specific transcriptional regulator TrmB